MAESDDARIDKGPPAPVTGASGWAVPYNQEAYDLGFQVGLDELWWNYTSDGEKDRRTLF